MCQIKLGYNEFRYFWGLMSVEITKTIRDGSAEMQDYIKVENGVYTHRQIEKIDGKVFMRCKSRKLFDVSFV